MRLLIQRVSDASVEVSGETVGSIGKGLLVFVGFGKKSAERDIPWMVEKLNGLRIFPDSEGHMNLNIHETSGEILVVSQFTLYGSCQKGRRPSFEPAMPPGEAEMFYDRFVQLLRESFGPTIQTGVFGADMQVSLTNDGPVTFWLERESGRDV